MASVVSTGTSDSSSSTGLSKRFRLASVLSPSTASRSASPQRKIGLVRPNQTLLPSPPTSAKTTPKIPEKLPEEIPMTNRSLMIKAIENDRQAFYERLYEKYAQLDAATNEEEEAEGSFALSDDGDWDVSDFHIPSPIPIRNERFQEYVHSHALYEEAQSVLDEVHHLEEEPTEDIIINCFGSDTEESSETDEDSPRQNQSTPLVDPLEEKNGISTMTPILPLPRTSPRARRNICPSFIDEIALSPPAKDQIKAISPLAPKRSKAKSPIRIVKSGPELLKKTGKLNKKHPSWTEESLADSTLANPKSLVKTPKVPSSAKQNHDTPKISYKKSPQTPQKQKKTTTALPKVAYDDTPVEPALKGSSKAMTVKGKANSSKAKKTTKAASPGPTRSSPRLREKSQNLSALDETSSDIENASPSSELSDLSNRSFVFGRADSLSIIKKAQLNQMKSRSFVQEVQDSPKKRPSAILSQTLAPSQQLNIVLGRPGSLAPLRSAQDEQLSKDWQNRRDVNRSLSVLDEMFRTPRRGTRNNSNRSKLSASVFQPRDSSMSATPTFEDFQHPLLQSAKLNRLGAPESSWSPQSPFGSMNRRSSPLTRNSSMISTSTFPEAEGSVCSVSSSVKRFRLRKKKTVT